MDQHNLDVTDPATWLSRGRNPAEAAALAKAWRDYPDLVSVSVDRVISALRGLIQDNTACGAAIASVTMPSRDASPYWRGGYARSRGPGRKGPGEEGEVA
jgi:hypothetical protein